MAEPRKVRCPKCSSLLTEPGEEAVYRCGVCSTFLLAKHAAARNRNLEFINSEKVYAVASEMSSCQSEEESSSESELAIRRRRVSASTEVWKNRNESLGGPSPPLNPPLDRKNIDCLENTQSSIHNDDDRTDDYNYDYDDYGDGDDGSFYATSDHTGEASDCSLDRFAMDLNSCRGIDILPSKKVEVVVESAAMDSPVEDIPLMKKVEGVASVKDIKSSKRVEGVVASVAMDSSVKDVPLSKKVEGVVASATMESSIKDVPLMKKVEGADSAEDILSSKKVEGVVASVAIDSSVEDIPSLKEAEGVVELVAMESSIKDILLSKKVEGVVPSAVMESSANNTLFMKKVEGLAPVDTIPSSKKVGAVVVSVAMDSSVEDIPSPKKVEGVGESVAMDSSVKNIPSSKKVEGVVASVAMESSMEDILLMKKVEDVTSVKDIPLKKVDGVVELVSMDSSVKDILLMKNVEGIASVKDIPLTKKVEGVASTEDVLSSKKVEGTVESVAMDSSVKDIPLMKKVEGVASTEDVLSSKKIEGIVESVAMDSSVEDIPLMKKVEGVVESVAMDSSVKDIPLMMKDEGAITSEVMESSVEDIPSSKRVEGVVVTAAMESSIEDVLSLKKVEGVVVMAAMESSVEDIPWSEKAKGAVAGAIESSISEIWIGEVDHEDGDSLALSAPSFRDFSEISYTTHDRISIHASSSNFQSSGIYQDHSSGDEVDLTGSTISRIIEEEPGSNTSGIVNRSTYNNNNLILSNDLLSFSSFCESMGKSSADMDLKPARSPTERYQKVTESQIDDAKYMGDFQQVRGGLSTTDDAKDSVNLDNRWIRRNTTADTNAINGEGNENHASPSFEIFGQHGSEHSKAATIDDSQMEMHGKKSMWSFDRKTANSANWSGSPYLEDSNNNSQSQSGQGHSSVRPCERGDKRHRYERVFMKESRQDEESFPNYSNLRVGNTNEMHGKPWRRDIATHMRLHTDYQANTEAKGLHHHPFSNTAHRDSAMPSSPSPTIGGRITPLPPPMYIDHPMNSCSHNPPICTLCLPHSHAEHQHCHCPVCSSSNNNSHSSLQMLAYSGFLQQPPPPLPHPHWPPYSGHHSHPPMHHYAPHATSYRSDSGSAPSGAKLVRPSHREKQRRKRYPLLPKDGAAPFVLCRHCFQLLEVPVHRLSSVTTTAVHKLRCGACMKILRFSVDNDEKLDISWDNRLNTLNHMSNPVSNSRLLYTTSGSGAPLLGIDSIMPESDMNSWGAQPPPLLAFHGRADPHLHGHKNNWSNEMPDQLYAGDFEQMYYPRNSLLLGDLNSSWQGGAIPKNQPSHGQGNPVYVNRNEDRVFPRKADYHGDYPQHGDWFDEKFQSAVGLSSVDERFDYQDPQSFTRSHVKGSTPSQQLKQVDYLGNGRFASAYPSACLDEHPIYGSLHSGGTSRDGSSNGRSPTPGSPLHEHLVHNNLLLDCDASLFDTRDSLGGRGRVGVNPKEGNRKALKSSTSFTGLLKRSLKDRTKGSRGVIVNTNSSPARRVIVNGQVISEAAVRKAEESAGAIESGSYWYDYRAGFWGSIGGPCNGIIPAMIEEFHYPMMRNCAGGMTRVLVNGRELHQKDLDILAGRGLPKTPGKAYIIDISGRVADETTGQPLQSLGKLAPSIEKTGLGSGMSQRLHN